METCGRCNAPLSPEAGERRQQWVGGFGRRKDAEEALGDVMPSVKSRTYRPPTNETIAEFLRAWLPAMPDLKATTREQYEITVEKYLVPEVGRIRLQDLSPDRLDAMYAKLLTSGRRRGGGGLSPKSVRNIHLVIHKALGTAVAWKKVPTNVADHCVAVPKAKVIRRAQRHKMRDRIWSPEVLRSFLAHVRSDRLYAAWLLYVTTGARRGELLGLRPEDVNLENGEITVWNNLVLVDHRPVLQTPKSESSQRTLSLDTATVAALRDYRKRQLEERLAWGEAYVESGLFFTREDGSMIHPERFSDWFRQHVEAAGLRRITLHGLRHSWATAALDAGVPLKVVSERLGHAGVAITADVYQHVLRTMDQDAAKTMAGVILTG